LNNNDLTGYWTKKMSTTAKNANSYLEK